MRPNDRDPAGHARQGRPRCQEKPIVAFVVCTPEEADKVIERILARRRHRPKEDPG